LRKLVAVSEGRRTAALKIGGRHNHQLCFDELERHLEKVEAEEMILRQNDRALIM
jgi:hypothetical protein